PLATNPPGKLNVLGHDGDALGVDGAEVGVLEQTHQVRLRRLLQCQHRVALEPHVVLKSCAISLTSLWNGSFLISSSVFF
ncbi:Os02g0457325, partial [Oryza sativa Japonica Group]